MNLLQVRQLLPRIVARVDLRMRLRNLPLLVDHVGDAPRVLVFRTVGRAVRHPEFVVGVGDQREREVVFLREGRVVRGLVEADADDFGVLLLVVAGEVPEPGTLCRSTGCVRFGEEPEHDFASAHVAESERAAVLIGRVEVGSGVTGFQHVWLPQ